MVLCSTLLALFIAFPVAKALAGAFFDEDGRSRRRAVVERIVNERIFGLGCLRRRRALRRGLEHALARRC